jgi:hypothetical protein
MGSGRVENQARCPYTAGSMRARLVPSRRLALAFVSLLGVILGVVLFSESARVPLRTPLVPRSARGEATAIALEGREGRQGTTMFRLALAVTDPRALAAHEELWLFFSSETPRARLVSAQLGVRGSDCAFTATGRDAIGVDELTVFRRSTSCSRPETLPSGTGLDLAVEVKGSDELALLGFEPLAGAAPGPIQAPPLGPRQAPLNVRGAFVRYPETAPRIVLLNHMWRVCPGIAWLAGLVCAATGLALAGCLAFPTRPLGGSSSAPAAAAAVVRSGGAAALFAASLAVLYAVLAPPLSGPDEPYHLLGYAELTKDSALAEDAMAWMGQTHLWRIRYNPDEHFRTIDVGQPYVVDDSQLRPTEVAQRSAVLARLERAEAPLLRGLPAPRVLLALRLLNALVFALAVGVATALAVALVPEPLPQWLAFPFLFVPSLPFFAMHVSETALLCSIYVLLAISLVVLFGDGSRSHWAGLPLGIATGLMLAGGRSPWPLTALVAAALLGRAALGPPAARRPRRDALVFWGGFGLGAAVFFVLLDDAYRSMTELYAYHLTRFIPSGLRAVGQRLLGRPEAAAGLVALGLALEIAAAPLRARVAARLDRPSPKVVRWTALGLVALVLVSLAASLLVAYPQLPLEPKHPLTAPERVIAVLGTMATMFRLADPNFLLSSTFWVGFGWLDTMPRPPFQSFLVLLVGLALCALLLHIARHGEGRRLLWLFVLAGGGGASLVLYALSTQAMPMALQGRYLIGWYLAVLAVVGTTLALDHRPPSRADAAPVLSGIWRATLLLALAGSIHVYCLAFVLRRYF